MIRKNLSRFVLLGATALLTAGLSIPEAGAARSSAIAESKTRQVTQAPKEAKPPADPRNMTFPPLKFQLPKSERVQLKNGVVVYLLQDRELPIVNLTAYLNAGSIYEPEAKTGLAGITGAVLRSGGTLKTPAEKLDRELEFMASSIESSIGSDNASVSFSTLSKNLDRTLTLFTEVVREPAFDPERVELARRHAVEGIRRQNDDPKGIAGRELARAIYAGHPLGRIPTIASVNAITRQDLVDYHRRFFYPGNMMVAVSGDFDREEMLKKLERLFGDWPNQSAPFPTVPAPGEEMTPAVLHVQKDVNQSVIRMGHLGIDKNNPDLYALKVMEYILGGGFTSRLTQEIRSNQGLAYNVDAYFEVGRRFKGPFIAETETKVESTARTIKLLASIISGMAESEVSEAELKLAKDSIINSFIFAFERSSSVVTQQARLEFYGYPAGYLENYRDNIARVTRADVLRVAKKYLGPDNMKLVVVGDQKRFDQPLSNFGKVQEIKLNNNQ